MMFKTTKCSTLQVRRICSTFSRLGRSVQDSSGWRWFKSTTTWRRRSGSSQPKLHTNSSLHSVQVRCASTKAWLSSPVVTHRQSRLSDVRAWIQSSRRPSRKVGGTSKRCMWFRTRTVFNLTSFTRCPREAYSASVCWKCCLMRIKVMMNSSSSTTVS